MTRQFLLLAASLLTQIPLASTSPQAAEGDEPVSCIGLSSIRRTEIIDDKNIAFFMRNGDVYLNRLDRACVGLRRDQPFSYRTSIGQLCNVDVITVLEDYGLGLTRGAACGLGMFEPSDKETLEALKARINGEEQPEITVKSIPVDPDAEGTPAREKSNEPER